MSQNWQTYPIKRILLPQQDGTKKLVAQYGDRLVCVRYRYDPKQQRKITTVEVVVDDRPWTPDSKRIHPNKRLALQVAYGEVEMGKAIKAAGGVWDSRRKVWRLAYKQVIALGLQARVVSDEKEKVAG
jgi:hypothetical protein